MAKKNLLVDRFQLVGESKTRRISERWSPEQFSGHPSLKLSYAAYGNSTAGKWVDLFRYAGARYWGFRKGAAKNNFRDFGYLMPGNSSPEEAGSSAARSQRVDNFVGFEINEMDSTINVSTPGQIDWALTNNKPSLHFGYPPCCYNNRPPPNSPNSAYTGAPILNGTITTRIKIIPDNAAWVAGSNYAHIYGNDDLYELRSGLYNTWSYYVAGANNLAIRPPSMIQPAPSCLDQTQINQILSMGGSVPAGRGCHGTTHAPADQADPAGNLSVFHSVLAADTGWGGLMNNFNRYYYDHAHEFYSPISAKDPTLAGAPVATKIARITPHYNFFAKGYETAASGLDERTLPNGYVVLNYIDNQNVGNIETETPNSDAVQTMYQQISCLYVRGAAATNFSMPRSRDQIANVGYGSDDDDVDSPLFKKSYIQKIASVNTEGRDLEFIKNRNEHMGFASAFIEKDFVEYSDGLGGDFLDPTGELQTNKSDIFFPFDITLEFDTRVPGYDLNNAAAQICEEIPGAYDFLLYNIMLANIKPPADDWEELDRDPTFDFTYSKMVYQNVIPMSTQITNVQEGTQTYYGFDWVHSKGEWGTNSAARAAGGPWHNKGAYHLRIIDLPWALDYCRSAANQPFSLYQPPPTIEQAPNPLVGQNTRNVAFGKGIFVGRPEVADHGADNVKGASMPGSIAWNMNREKGNTVLTATTFKEFIKKLARMALQKKRSYADLLDGKLAYSETIAYKIEKRVVTKRHGEDAVANRPIQTFYLPNLSSLRKLKYVDTQVKYGQRYVYSVYAYNLVIGDCYNYKNQDNASALSSQWTQDMSNPPSYTVPSTSIPQPLGGTATPNLGGLLAGTGYISSVEGYSLDRIQLATSTATFTVNQFGSIKLIEVPYFTYDPTEVRDLPPVFPEVEVVPFRAVSNKIRFLLQTQDVKYAFSPEKFIIEPSDLDAYELQRNYQGRPTGPIVFGSDDTEIIFNIYRTTERPRSYEDFSGQLLASVDGVTPSGARAVNIGYDDKIEPNRVYYYTFRCSDVHGGISIPSPVYQVELVDDNGRIFPAVDVFYIGEKQSSESAQLKSVTKCGKKYLQIGASLAQSIVNTEGLTGENISSEMPPPPALLTTQADGVWSTSANKQVIKVRLTSKQTGKKMDINVELLENPIANPNEQE